MHKKILAAMGVAICLLLTACVVDSKNPLGAPESAQIDERLLGNWVAKNGDVVRFTVKDAHWMSCTSLPKAEVPTNFSKSTEGQPKPDSFFVTKIGNDMYLNFPMESKDERRRTHPAYSLFRYVITTDQKLKMWGLSQDAMEAAIRTGKLKGTIHDRSTTDKPPRKDVDVHLTDSTENLVKYISRNDPADLFDAETDELSRVAAKGD